MGWTPLVEGNDDGAEELTVRGAAAGVAVNSAVRVQLVTRAATTARAPRARPGTDPSWPAAVVVGRERGPVPGPVRQYVLEVVVVSPLVGGGVGSASLAFTTRQVPPKLTSPSPLASASDPSPAKV